MSTSGFSRSIARRTRALSVTSSSSYSTFGRNERGGRMSATTIRSVPARSASRSTSRLPM